MFDAVSMTATVTPACVNSRTITMLILIAAAIMKKNSLIEKTTGPMMMTSTMHQCPLAIYKVLIINKMIPPPPPTTIMMMTTMMNTPIVTAACRVTNQKFLMMKQRILSPIMTIPYSAKNNHIYRRRINCRCTWTLYSTKTRRVCRCMTIWWSYSMHTFHLHNSVNMHCCDRGNISYPNQRNYFQSKHWNQSMELWNWPTIV